MLSCEAQFAAAEFPIWQPHACAIAYLQLLRTPPRSVDVAEVLTMAAMIEMTIALGLDVLHGL